MDKLFIKFNLARQAEAFEKIKIIIIGQSMNYEFGPPEASVAAETVINGSDCSIEILIRDDIILDEETTKKIKTRFREMFEETKGLEHDLVVRQINPFDI